LIHPDPISLLVGWGSDFQRQMSEAYALYRAKFPSIEAIAIVGDSTASGFSFEKAVSLDPDLVILSLSMSGTRHSPGDLVEKFEAAGIPVVVVDFFLQPFRDTVPSLRILGRLLDREAAAESFIEFYETRRRRLAERLGEVARPSVFMHAHAGSSEGCYSPGKGTFDDYIMAAGGRNIASALLPGATGQISLEQLLAQDPAIYVATGGTHFAKSGGLVLGQGVSADIAASSFATQVARPGIEALSAVRNGRAYGLWHLFNDTPTHIVAIETLAKWFHPAILSDIDPQATLDEISRRFSAIPLQGTFWVEMAGAKPPVAPSVPAKP